MITVPNLTLTGRLGDDLRLIIAIRDPDTGDMLSTPTWTARMQVRLQAGEPGAPLLDLETGQSTTAGSGLSFDTDGNFELLIKAADIGSLPVSATPPTDVSLAYDVKMRDDGGDIATYLAGVLVITTPATLDPPPSAG